MKKLRKMAALLLVCACIGMTVQAQDNQIEIHLNGEKIKTEVAPILVNGRTMVPLRAVCEAMDCDVDWINETKEIKIKHPLTLLHMKVDSYYIKVSYARSYTYVYSGDTQKTSARNKEIELDVPPILYQNRTMIPIRAVAEALPATVEWDGAAKRVLIQTRYEKNGDNVIVRTFPDDAYGWVGKRYQYTFDKSKNVSNRKLIDGNKNNSVVESIDYFYDSASNCIAWKSDGSHCQYTYDSLGRITKAVRDFTSDEEFIHRIYTMEYFYDEKGRNNKVVRTEYFKNGTELARRLTYVEKYGEDSTIQREELILEQYSKELDDTYMYSKTTEEYWPATNRYETKTVDYSYEGDVEKTNSSSAVKKEDFTLRIELL